jgi:branched-chain amino acid transport system ATP-binding protein
MEDEIILSVNEIGISFGGLEALAGIDIRVRKDDLLGLVGPNGAGKTVLMNCINGVYAPSRGTIYFNGVLLNGIPRWKFAAQGIARSFQNIELFKQMNVIENTMVGAHFRTRTNIITGGLFWGRGKKEEIEVRREAEEILDYLELYHYRKQMVGDLSYGTQKLVGLARALAMRPKILLLDEIASGLNREEKEDLARFILRIKYDRGIPIIWVEHDMEMVTQLCNRMVCLNNGKKLCDGSPEEVTSNATVIEAYLCTTRE